MGRTARVSREQVLAAARETFVERGFEGATLAGIGAKLSVSPAALLRHAPNKKALFLASMGSPEPDMAPLAFLEKLDGSEDPRQVLRRVAETMVPFLEARIGQIVARWVYFKTLPGIGRVPLPFDPNARPTPPQKNLRFLEDWVRRAVRSGRLSLDDPRAAAFAVLRDGAFLRLSAARRRGAGEADAAARVPRHRARRLDARRGRARLPEEETMKRAFAAVTMALAAAGAPAAEREISLSESIDRALGKNQDIAIQKEAVDAAAANLRRADGTYDPEFRLDFRWQEQTEAVNFIFSGAPPGSVGPTSNGVLGQAAITEFLPTGGTVSLGTTIGRSATDNIFTLLTPAYSTFVGIDLRQPLLQNREIDPQRRLIQVASLEHDRSRAQLQAVVADTVAAVERAYWTLSAALSDVAVREESVRLAEVQESETRTRIQAGFFSESDIAVPQAEVERRRVDLYVAREAAQRAALDLKTLMLDDPADPLWDDALRPSDSPETPVVSLDVPAELAQAPGRRPEVAEAAAGLAKRDVDSQAAKNRILPRFDLVASYGRYGLAGTVNPDLVSIPGFPVTIPPEVIGGLGRSYGTIGENAFPDATVGFTFGLPIGNRSAKADAAAAEAERRQAAILLAREKQRVGVEVRTAALALEAAAQSIEAARAGLNAARTQLEAENVRFSAGLTSNYFVLTRQNELAQAARTRTAALTAYRKALADYARACGTLLAQHHIEFADDGPAVAAAGGAR